MTGPQTITLWTAERANRALPLVRRIADDLVRTYELWRKLVAEFEVVSIGVTSAATAEAERLQREAQRAATDIEGFVQELTALGVECKSLESGLFDFPSERDGRIVYLCWLHGERTVGHWHEIDGGFAGRQPLE
jgi:hypothetical protein